MLLLLLCYDICLKKLLYLGKWSYRNTIFTETQVFYAHYKKMNYCMLRRELCLSYIFACLAAYLFCLLNHLLD